jgi:hypothetical protein
MELFKNLVGSQVFPKTIIYNMKTSIFLKISLAKNIARGYNFLENVFSMGEKVAWRFPFTM